MNWANSFPLAKYAALSIALAAGWCAAAIASDLSASPYAAPKLLAQTEPDDGDADRPTRDTPSAAAPPADAVTPAVPAETPPADSSASPADEEEDAEAATDADAAAIKRNELLAEIDARYTPWQAEAKVDAAPTSAPNLLLAISVSLGIGFVVLVAATLLVLKP